MDVFEDVVDPDELARHMDDPRWVIVDCQFNLADPRAGRRRYTVGHIPGAQYAHLDVHLSRPPGPEDGRHPLPRPDELAALLTRWGVDGETQIVAYDDAGGVFASRLWWLCRWLGHDAVAVLDGGLQAWTDAGYGLSTRPPSSRPGDFDLAPRTGLVVSAEEVQRDIAEQAIVLIDARSRERFRGEVEPMDPVAGHIPGAVNRPYAANLDDEGRFRPPEELQADFASLLDGRSPHDAVAMCGSGVTACHHLLAMHYAGLHDARLYPGSWSEWIQDPRRPTEPARSMR